MGLFSFKTKWRKIEELIEIEIDNPRSTRVDIIISTSKQTYSGYLNPQEKREGMHKVYLAGNEDDQVRISQTNQQSGDCFNQVFSLKVGTKSNVFLFERGE